MTKKKKYEMVEVEWNDAHCSTGGDDNPENHAPYVTYSCGYVVKRTKLGITIAQDCYKEDPGCYKVWSFIPRGMIIRVTKLAEKMVEVGGVEPPSKQEPFGLLVEHPFTPTPQ